MQASKQVKTDLRRRKLFAALMLRYKNVSNITLFHLAIAIDLKYSSYVTEAPELLKDAEYIKKKYKINIVSASSIVNIQKGVII